MGSSLLLASILVLTSFLSVFAALVGASLWSGWRVRAPRRMPAHAAMFLLGPGDLVDTNRRGSALLDDLRRAEGGEGTCPDDDRLRAADDRNRLLAHLLPRFPDLRRWLDAIAAGGDCLPGGTVLRAGDGSGLELAGNLAPDGFLRLTLGPSPEKVAAGDDVLLVDPLSWQALRDENALLRRTVDQSPSPCWRTDADGQVVWANGAYLRLLRDVHHGAALTWPLPALFDAAAAARGGRQGLALGTRGRQAWFDLVATPDGEGMLLHALPADEAQKAERTRREFVQTLSKTFATLPIGLAVFDRTRRLHLFNPALADLTRLEPEFLASRPGLEGFLNRMRDKRILPEPRDFRAWTRRLLEVETAGTGANPSGGFEETWSLADGRCFRVSAAPHPDGALAFLIEDITADTRMKRSFRAELETGQTALDLIDTGLAMFAPSGELVLTNAAFDRLWTLEGAETLSGVRLGDALANWREVTDGPGPWDRIEALCRPGAPRTEVAGVFNTIEGETMEVRARLAPNGGLLLSFRLMEDAGGQRPLASRARLAAQRAFA